MTEIILCSQSMKPDYISNICGIENYYIHGLRGSDPDTISAFTPYALGQDITSFDKQVMSQLSSPAVTKELTSFSLSFGGDNTLALAEIAKTLRDSGISMIGPATSVYAGRIGGFVGAVKEYQDALMAYRDALSSNSATKMIAKDKAYKAFQALQVQFRHELNAVNATVKSRRGTSLTSFTRATNIAKSSRNVAKLDVISKVEAENLVKFTKYAKFLGNGLAVIDFGSRVGNIHNSYQTGGNWEREMFIESSSFATSAIAGSLAVQAGSAVLGMLVVATPIGWVGLVIGGIAVAGAGAATSIAVNNAVKENSGSWYDSIMKFLGVI